MMSINTALHRKTHATPVLSLLMAALLGACATSRPPPAAPPKSVAWILQQSVADDPGGVERVIALFHANRYQGVAMHGDGLAHRFKLEDATLYSVGELGDAFFFYIAGPHCYRLDEALRNLGHPELRTNERGSLKIETPYSWIHVCVHPEAPTCVRDVLVRVPPT